MRQDRYLRRVSLALIAPAILAVGLLFLVPLGRLVAVSLNSPELTFANYQTAIGPSGFPSVMLVTLRVTLIVTLSCACLGFPIAYLMVRAGGVTKTVIGLLVILPFWISILVRNYAWIYLLQRRGTVNNLLVSLGWIDQPLNLIYNEFAVVLAMTNALLPFMVLPIYVALQSQDSSYLEAAHTLGAGPAAAFADITLPLAYQGIVAGSLIVFATGLGFYVTPALLGGGKVLTAATFVTQQIEVTLNWQLAAAAALILFGCIVALMGAYARIVGINRLSGIEG